MADAEGGAAPRRRADLKARTGSALVMVSVAALALWLGGLVWTGLVVLVAAGVLWEWVKLVHAIAPGPLARAAWLAAGMVYVGLAAEVLAGLRAFGAAEVLPIVLAVIATDVGAYFAGRSIGGAKIAPKISPGKTWAGLLGGMATSAAAMVLLRWLGGEHMRLFGAAIAGALIAVIAQAGDFFESWMKRRAGVKDSGRLLPGHGGLFDRVDGLLAVCAAVAVAGLASSGIPGIF